MSGLSILTSQENTICALATAPGGALGIIRVSGPNAFDAVSSICSVRCSECAGNTLHYTHIFSPIPSKESAETSGEVVDEVILSIFRSPHSYTGEDSVEISCHGSSYILNKILELLVENGCRMANPGEYTQRAFLNGKLDLSQAEAVADLIASSNKATHQMAMSQLRGKFSSELKMLRDQLLKLTSLLELELDFSDHEDLEFADRSELLELAQKIDVHISRLAHTFQTGQALKKGIPVAIVGKTNVGKSTLLNRLIKDERAIVSDIHGTTRDSIEETMDIHGVSFRFIDTAGIRNTTDTIEQIGIERTYQMIEKARIVLWLIDDNPTNEELQEIEKRCNDKSLIIIKNKKDINSINLCDISIQHTASLQISAKYDEDLSQLEQAIYEAADIPVIADSDVIISNARHYQALLNASQNLSRVLGGLQSNLSGDLLSEELRMVLSDLAEITGEGQITTNEVLGNIFKNFCVGK